MGKIHVLDMAVSNKIAAGEVVERPMSVVKELVENSIDAGANVITVEIKNGGRTYIRVTDNGCGMEPDDAHIAFLRHATSKIHHETDLDAIYTLGFRGEALSSIGAVARVELFTKRAEDEIGTHVICNGGEIISDNDAGMGDGTTIIVKDLFYNTPARMKFMKKDATEGANISDLINRFVLSHPEISFKFINGGKTQLFSPGDNKIISSVYTVYGKDYKDSVIDVEYENDNIKISGVIGKGTLARPNRNCQSFFVNKRYIKSAMITKALEEAYKNQIMIGKFPFAVLNIEINPMFIDINVHPTKLEVKFSDDKSVYEAVYYSVKNALYKIPDIPKIQYNEIKREEDIFKREAQTKQIEFCENNEKILKKPEVKQSTQIKSRELSNDFLKTYQVKNDKNVFIETKEPEKHISHIFSEDKPKKTNIDENKVITDNKEEKTSNVDETIYNKNNFKVCGQVFDTYIIIQKDDDMMLIDQHAAHERIKYEQLKTAVKNKQLYPQILLEPVTITLTAVEMDIFENNKQTFYEMGFEADVFGDNEIIVRTSPDGIEWGCVEELILELLTQMQANKKEIISYQKERVLYTIACKAAIKANHSLTTKEMEALVGNVLELENINTCPHGRPIMISMTKKELEKMFKRIV